MDDVEPGQRVFDVKLQGKVVLENLDIVREARGKNTALVKEFRHVVADALMELELVPRAKELTNLTVPIISGVEVGQERDG